MIFLQILMWTVIVFISIPIIGYILIGPLDILGHIPRWLEDVFIKVEGRKMEQRKKERMSKHECNN
jgi:hypothetical protein